MKINKDKNYISFYRRWAMMKSRCFNEENKDYKYYGGRGIRVCKHWLVFLNFKNDIYKEYVRHVKLYGIKNTQIDRINVNLGYKKSNTRFVTVKEQLNNMRNNHLITYRNKTMTLAQWAEKVGLPYTVLRARINMLKWSVEKSLNTPNMKRRERYLEYDGKKLSIKEWSELFNISYDIFYGRLRKRNFYIKDMFKI